MKETTVFIILDAFRWDYIDQTDTPTLYKMAQGGIYAQKLISSTGFTQRTSIFSGTYPDISGNFTMFSFDENRSPYRFLHRYSKLLSFASSIGDRNKIGAKLEEILRGRILAVFTKKYAAHAPLAFIPFEILPRIGITEDQKPIYESNALSVETIFDILRKENKDFEYLMFPLVTGDDEMTLKVALKKAIESSSLFMFQFSDSDYLMHQWGTSGEERKRMVREMDRKINSIKEVYEKTYNIVNFIIIGDHGMTDVKETIDFGKTIIHFGKLHNLKHGLDYILFLDSTMAKIKFENERAERKIKEFVIDNDTLNEKGVIITPLLAKRFRIPFHNKLYGDIIWWANSGVLIFPDYFHSKVHIVKGMHGYDSYYEDMKGFAVVYSKNSIKKKDIPEVKLVDICPTLCDLLNIKYPKQNEGASLFKY